ncbi:hypothetical protein GW915_11050 [bacterium]|nr:hypothetical protein [bacterium]
MFKFFVGCFVVPGVVIFSTNASSQDSLPSKQNQLFVSKDLVTEVARIPLENENKVEIYLPANRCDLGWVKWGDEESGYKKCRALGRGETKFGSVERLERLRSQSKHYDDWTIGDLPAPVDFDFLKEKERDYVSGSQAEACLFKPDYWSNGKTISKRPTGSLGTYKLYTKASGSQYHRAKSAWGRDSEGSLLPGVKMIEIKSEEDKKYARKDLLDRYDFYLHSHENDKEDHPLEALSTWGCPRLPLHCQEDFYQWVFEKNAAGVTPEIIIREDDTKAYAFHDE